MDNKEVSIKFNNKVSGAQDLKTYEKRLRNIYSYITAIKKGQKSAFKDLEKNVIAVEKPTEDVNKNLDKVAKKANVAFNFKGLKEAGRGILNLGKNIKKLTDQYSAYIENINLLEVAYSRQKEGLGDYNEQVKENSKQVKELINQMSKVYGLDESRLTRQFGIFKQLSNAMQLPADTAEQLSEHLVKMTNDIASLYNLDLDRASNALQSAMAGQVRPIRSATGADITEKTLQQTVDALGLDRSISQLSYVEKRLIMIISLTEQLKKSQGDYGRTIESVSNQTRVLKEQWERVKRSVGEMAYPLVKIILPYVNAILMVVAKIADLLANVIAKLLHVNLEEEFDYNTMAGVNDATLDLEENLFGAGEQADKLKEKLNGLRGFDKLNIISSPKDATSGLSTGIDPKILSAFDTAFSDYSAELDKIQMKATKIADAIWKWLEGEDKSYANLKIIGTVLGVIAGIKIVSTVKNVFSFIKGLKEAGKKIGDAGSAGGLIGKVFTLKGGLTLLAVVLGTLATIQIVKCIKQGEELGKSLDELNKQSDENKKKTDELTKSYDNMISKQGETKESIDTYLIGMGKLIDISEKSIEKSIDEQGNSKKVREYREKEAESVDILVDKMRDMYEQGKLDDEQTKIFTDNLSKQIGIMEALGQNTDDLRDEFEKLTGKKWETTLTARLEDKVSDNLYKIVDGIKKYFSFGGGGKSSFGSTSGGGFRANGGVFAGGKWHDITQYAGGTSNAPVGQMFIARERGAELVGNLNGHTAVMNNDQIVASVSDGVYRAVKMAGGTSNQNQTPQIYNIYLDESHKIVTYTLEQLQGMAKTNGKPITITG